VSSTSTNQTFGVGHCLQHLDAVVFGGDISVGLAETRLRIRIGLGDAVEDQLLQRRIGLGLFAIDANGVFIQLVLEAVMRKDVARNLDQGLECGTAERLFCKGRIRREQHRQAARGGSGGTGGSNLEKLPALGLVGCGHPCLLCFSGHGCDTAMFRSACSAAFSVFFPAPGGRARSGSLSGFGRIRRTVLKA